MLFSTTRRISVFLFLCFYLCSVKCGADRTTDSLCADGPNVGSQPNKQYGATERSMHKFDFFSPDDGNTEPRPLILFLHPGAFITGDKGNYFMQIAATDFARCGFATATLNYRLMTDITRNDFSLDNILRWVTPVRSQIYDAIRDVRTAIRYFKANAETYQIDPNRIYLFGYSAGAIIALNIAFLNDGDSSSFFPRMVVAGENGCLDCLPFNGERPGSTLDASVAGVVAINGALFDLSGASDADVARTPVLFIYSDNDNVIPLIEGMPFEQLLNEEDITVKLPYIAFELGITEKRNAAEFERTTINGLSLSLVIPKWLPILASERVIPNVVGSEGILEKLNGNYKHKLKLKGGHNFMTDPQSGKLNRNYAKLFSAAKKFLQPIERRSEAGRNRRQRH